MSFTLAGVFAEAGALWRRDRDLLLRIAAVFFFLPLLAARLFLVPEDTADLPFEEAMRTSLAWLGQNLHWLAGQLVFQLFGSGALLMLMLDRGRPSVGQAFARTLRLLPALLAAWVATSLLTLVGLVPFILPGLYAAGRTFLVWPVLVAEPDRGPLGAFAEGIRRSHRRGWLLMFAGALPVVAATFAGGMVDGIGEGLKVSAWPPAKALFEVLACAIAAAGGLAHVVLQAGAYRLAGAPSKGM